MAPTLITDQVYSSRDFAGVVVLVVCSMLSFISVLGVFVILGVSLIRSGRDKTCFVHTQLAKFLSSLLLCNLIQAIGGLLNIAWLVEHRVYLGVTCTTQAALKQIGNTGPAIFTFVIAAYTFCHLFLRNEWKDRTCHIVHIASWALLLLELCIENFAVADLERGPYYGITTSGYWCWISPKYLIERYTTDYLFMTASATFSFILYLLVFFGIRGNISVSGYKVSFQRRPVTRFGIMDDGTLAMTDDPRVESFRDIVAKQMLWYPVVYVCLILPIAASRLSTFHGKPVPFGATIFTAAVFMLHGFFNTMLFCTTRSILPGTWRQRVGLGTIWHSGRGSTNRSNSTNATCQFTLTSIAVPGTTQFAADHSVDVDGAGIKDASELSSSCIGSGSSPSPPSPTIPTLAFQSRGGSGQRANAHEHHIRLCSLAPRDTRTSTRSDIDVDDKGRDLGLGVHMASVEKTEEWEVPQHPGRASSDHDSSAHGPAQV